MPDQNFLSEPADIPPLDAAQLRIKLTGQRVFDRSQLGKRQVWAIGRAGFDGSRVSLVR